MNPLPLYSTLSNIARRLSRSDSYLYKDLISEMNLAIIQLNDNTDIPLVIDIAVKRAYDYVRKVASHNNRLVPIEYFKDLSCSGNYNNIDNVLTVSQLINMAQLNTHQKRVIEYALAGYNNRDIASTLHCNIKSIRAHKNQACKILRGLYVS